MCHAHQKRIGKVFLLLVIGLTFALAQLSLAEEEKVYELGRIVVTATRTESQMGDVPASVSVVTKEDVENSTAHFADQALKSVSGAYQKRSKFMDIASSVTLRGFSGDERTLIMLDGQSLNDAYSSGVQWPSIPTENIERIEVVKGPFSSLYGANAMGGVINIITKTPKKRQITIKSGYGTYHTFCSHLDYTDMFLKRFGFYLSVDNKSTNGYRNQLVVKAASSVTGTTQVTGWERTKSPTGATRYLIGDKGENYWDQWQYAGKLNWDISDVSKLSFSTNISKSRYGYSDPRSYLKDANGNEVTSGSITFNDNGDKKITTSPYDSLQTSEFLQGEGGDCRNLYMLNYLTSFGDTKLKARFGVNDDSTWYINASSGATKTAGPGKINETDPKRSIQFETQFDIPIKDKHTFTLGLGHRQDEAKGEEWDLSDWPDPKSKTTLSTSMKGKQRTESLFVQLEMTLLERLKGFAGGRFDYWKNYAGESFSSPTTTTYADKTDSYFSPKVGFVWTPGFSLFKESWKLETVRVSCGKAFRPPTLYDLYKTYTSSAGKTYESNPNLSPETSLSWEIGLEQSVFRDKTKISSTYFESYIEDLIYSKEVISSTLYHKENAGKGEIRGVEMEVKQYICPWLDIFGNFTYQRTKITENAVDPDSVGKQFTFVPEKMYNLGLSLHIKRLEGSLTWRWVDKVFTSSANTDTEKGVYGAYDIVKLLDAKLSYQVNKNAKVSLAVDNILDRDYYQTYKAPGRTFFGEAEIKF
jgi:iron complex outermembrane receptor protein